MTRESFRAHLVSKFGETRVQEMLRLAASALRRDPSSRDPDPEAAVACMRTWIEGDV